MGKKFEKNKHFKVFQCVGILDSCQCVQNPNMSPESQHAKMQTSIQTFPISARRQRIHEDSLKLELENQLRVAINLHSRGASLKIAAETAKIGRQRLRRYLSSKVFYNSLSSAICAIRADRSYLWLLVLWCVSMRVSHFIQSQGLL